MTDDEVRQRQQIEVRSVCDKLKRYDCLFSVGLDEVGFEMHSSILQNHASTFDFMPLNVHRCMWSTYSAMIDAFREYQKARHSVSVWASCEATTPSDERAGDDHATE